MSPEEFMKATAKSYEQDTQAVVMRRLTDVKARPRPNFHDRRIRMIQPGSKWIDRFQEALRLLTGSQPTIEMCKAWVADDNEDLQEWVNTQRHTPEWVQGIAIIDAARLMATQPVDGEGHQDLFDEVLEAASKQARVEPELPDNGVDPW
jgi:hypothetical protein